MLYQKRQEYSAFKYYQLIKSKTNDLVLIGSKTSQSDYYFLYIKYMKKSHLNNTLTQIIMQKGPFESYEETKKQIRNFIPKSEQTSKVYIKGIIGFHQLFQGYYLIYISESEQVAKIGNHIIYEVKKTQIIKLFESSQENLQVELKHYQLLKQTLFENFYYSISYDLTNKLSDNLNKNRQTYQKNRIFPKHQNINSTEEIFLWNYYLLQQFSKICMRHWCIGFIHGYCYEFKKIFYESKNFNVVLIARRSRHHAGTRYLKRGINQNGFVANHVEIQQIVCQQNRQKLNCSSYIQMRGSTPIYWYQQPHILIVQPSIQINDIDQNYVSTQKHFFDLMERYGKNIFCINLMRKIERTPRQTLLSQNFRKSLENIKKTNKSLKYLQFDLKQALKDHQDYIKSSALLAYYLVLNTGVFAFKTQNLSNYEIYYQDGVIRTNCVDCLDRTNSFQEIIGQIALKTQLRLLCGQEIIENLEDLSEKILEQFSQIYEEMGNILSIQYGGSQAHPQKIIKKTNEQKILTSLKRHWNNNINDEIKQQKIDILLGMFPKSKPYVYQSKSEIKLQPDDEILQSFYQDCFEPAYINFKNKNHLQVLNKIGRHSQEPYFKTNIMSIFNKGEFQPITNKFNKAHNGFIDWKDHHDFVYFKIPLNRIQVMNKNINYEIKLQQKDEKRLNTLRNRTSKFYEFESSNKEIPQNLSKLRKSTRNDRMEKEHNLNM